MAHPPVSCNQRHPHALSFHDGLLTSITVAEGTATLGLETSDNRSFELRMTGVKYMRAEDFKEGNIVMHVEVVQGAGPKWADVEACLTRLREPPLPGVAERYNIAHSAWLTDTAIKIQNGELALISLESSYGCDLIALCSEATLIEQC